FATDFATGLGTGLLEDLPAGGRGGSGLNLGLKCG
ncbi:MAG: hypothetical protein RLZZ603_1127, partial [Actinomycetota bacterium]